MFNNEFEKAIAELDDLANPATESYADDSLEAALKELENDDVAQEGLFTKKKPVEDLLKKVQKRVDKCKTAEECEDLKAKVAAEIEKFNGSFDVLKKAGEDLRDGNIDKKQFQAIAKPVLKELKKTCDTLKFGNIVESEKELNDEDFNTLKDFLAGAKDIIAKKTEELSADATDAGEAGEGCKSSSMESLLNAIMDEDDINIE